MPNEDVGTIKLFELPIFFRPLDDGEPAGIHDYFFDPQTGGFDYVDIMPVGSLTFGVRPIISPIDILDMLQNDVCVCGDYKPRTRAFCKPCFDHLPTDAGRALYRRFRKGYEQAFFAAIAILVDAGRTDVKKILAAVPKPKATTPNPAGSADNAKSGVADKLASRGLVPGRDY